MDTAGKEKAGATSRGLRSTGAQLGPRDHPEAWGGGSKKGDMCAHMADSLTPLGKAIILQLTKEKRGGLLLFVASSKPRQSVCLTAMLPSPKSRRILAFPL